MTALRGRRAARIAALAVVASALTLPACAVNGLAFKQDTRLSFAYPDQRDKVRLPLTVRWSVREFEVTGPTPNVRPGAGYFAVFVDRSPQPPGKTLGWFARNDRSCQRDPTCPDDQYFAERNVYAVNANEFTIEYLRPPNLGSKIREFHEITVALVDGEGRRLGETAYTVEFQVLRGRP
ncbi:MAG: hypothetical protein H0U92_10790 [Actinobacteria bacterium]|nr:hypothetical protein [Actinomycetota bacterium]